MSEGMRAARAAMDDAPMASPDAAEQANMTSAASMRAAPASQAIDARQIWQGFHWAFFVNVQGLILSLLRFEAAMEAGRQGPAATELRSAATLLRASGAAMRLAGSFSAQDYLDDVRVSMMPPHVRSVDFSGLMSWDHARLIRLWQQIGARLGGLPDSMADAHTDFVDAFVEMIGSHRAVCARFVGEEAASLRSSDCALGVLEKVLSHRLRIIDPQSRVQRCPFTGKATASAPSNEGAQP